MEEYVYVNGKKLRKGFTTGTCATAAAASAASVLFGGEKVSTILVNLPKGEQVYLSVEDIRIGKNEVIAFVRKDGGDDIDVTHGLLIGAKVSLMEGQEIEIVGGEGVGLVTKPGLAQPVGTHAINPVPRKMILKHIKDIREAFKKSHQGILVEIFVPDGEAVATKTFNPRLGIQGGISILGTTGIVTPMSVEAWQTSISYEIQMRYEAGFKNLILSPGNYGEHFGKENLNLLEEDIVNMSNFVGYCLDEGERIGFERIIMIGHIGKLVKVASGIFNTHSRVADARIETLVSTAAILGAPHSLIMDLAHSLTTEEACRIIDEAKFQKIYQVLADKIKNRALTYLKYRSRPVEVEVVIFSSEKGFLASTCDLKQIRPWALEKRNDEG